MDLTQAAVDFIMKDYCVHNRTTLELGAYIATIVKQNKTKCRYRHVECRITWKWFNQPWFKRFKM